MKIVLALMVFAFAFSSCDMMLQEPETTLETNGALTIAFDQMVGAEAEQQAQFFIFNETDVPYWIAAYDKTSDGNVTTITPLYQFEVERNGAWSREFRGWNDAGVELYEIAPGEKWYFTTDLPHDASAWRTGLVIRTSNETEAPEAEVWSSDASL